ncbi:MAG: HEAT repeat domain-containing protein [Promethearchaeota archaeon]
MLDKFKDIGKLVGIVKDDEIKDLLKDLTSENFRKLNTIIQQDPDKIQEIIVHLSDKNRKVRMNAALALGTIGDLRAVEPLIVALSDKRRIVRREAANSLGELRDERSAEPLIKALKDKDSGVRMFSARALGRLGDERALDPILELLSDKDTSVSQWACEAIGELGIARQDAIDTLKRLLKHKNKRLELSAAGSLGRLGDKSGFDLAMDVLEGGRLRKGDKFLRAYAAEALGYIGDPLASPLLMEAAQSKDKFLREAAIKALERIR